MKGKDGGHRLVVADGVVHVTAVLVLRDPGGAAQPGGQAAPQGGVVVGDRGAGAAKAPQDPVGPGGFPLLGTEQNKMAESFTWCMIIFSIIW